MRTRPKNASEIAAMREGGKLLITVLQATIDQVKPGVTTQDLANFADKKLKELNSNARPAILGYHGFPDVICVSVNDEVVHGIPGKRVINEGDIVGLDYCVLYKGMITDAARSTIAGEADPKDVALLKATQRALDASIDEVADGVKVGTMGAAAQAVLNEAGLGNVRDFVGHGVGHQMHEDPNIPNYGTAGQGPMLSAGMTIAIEPMATRGGDDVRIKSDGWTVVTLDGSRSAHFEDTVLVTEEGAEILTRI